MQQHHLSTGFIQLNQRQLFLRTMQNSGGNGSAVIVIPPFAEEMNKSRHLLNAAMRQLAAAGYSCFMLDNYGTGDSAGDLDQASIDIWRDDLYQLLLLLQQQGYQNINFIAVRFGVIQLFDLMNKHILPLPMQQLVLWQPVFDVSKFWQQFVRLKVAEAMAAGNKISQKDLEQQLSEGENIEIAGYPISPAFYHSLLDINSSSPAQLSGIKLQWLETSQLDTVALPVQKMREQLQQHCQLHYTQLKAEPYWQTAELASAEQLIALTLQYLTEGAQHD
ncbi:exosortase A system-associated hydrolase 2 [Rheinheimera pacifica]|uniref:Exosortase A system-associated hydrolase 2 n=1 Tax=Rheinheimera pacifica TaxID=173990 RepID=A0A1H6KKL7_9GAMM|nr:glycosyl transferase [Rheinheimera pacifica]SEH72073.1 exosortase A system-associated hydrolase 2 [Rheinheimera pacifica]